jgi:hypothetical protein
MTKMTSQTILFVVGCFSLTFGTGATMYSRWNHAENARVHPVFHLWAILVGLAFLALACWKPRSEKW